MLWDNSILGTIVELSESLQMKIMKNLMTILMCLTFLGAFAENEDQKSTKTAEIKEPIVSSADYETEVYVEVEEASIQIEPVSEQADSEVAPY